MSITDRRKFIASATASGAFTILPRHVLGGTGYIPPSDKLTIAHIGMGTEGFGELGDLLGDPAIQIVSVCDPNTDSSDYVEWSKGSVRNRIRSYLGNPRWRENDNGCPGGREVGREVVNTYYANQRGKDNFTACSAYADFRELLAKEKDVDAVKIMTPDHLHATISIAAMKSGRHVLMHKPIANRMYEERLVIETARKTKRATHLLAYGSGIGNGKIAARVKEGAVGTLREIHNWSNRPVWPQYTQIPAEKLPLPKGFDWDLWLGPALERPYSPHYTHAVFRGWYDFGGGAMADMGIYSLWPVFTGLELGSPVSAEASPTHTCEIVDNVSRQAKSDFAFPAACTIRFKFAPRADMPNLNLFWYDGGIKPRMPEEVEHANVSVPIEGILFIGEKGSIMAGFNGQNPQLFAGGTVSPLFPEDARPAAPSRDAAERSKVWLPSFKGGQPSPGSFPNAAAISDAVTLGTISLRAGQKVLFDAAAMKITNSEAANRFMYREYRKGWEL